MNKMAILSSVACFAVSLLSLHDLHAGDKVIFVADPRAHVVGSEGSDDLYGLVHNFMNYDSAVEETLTIGSGSSIYYLTGPQTPDGGPPRKGCEAVWFPGAPTSTVGFQFVLRDMDVDPDTVITTGSQTWTHTGPSRAMLNCKNNGQVKIQEPYSSPLGTSYLKRRIDVTTVVIQGDPPDTTASVMDPFNFVVKVTPPH